MQIEKITSGKLNNNTFILSNDKDECILIDCSCDIDEIIKRTKDLKVLGVFLTHGHYDHFMSLEKVVNKFEVKCYISSLDYEKLFNPKMNYSIVFNKIHSVKLNENKFVLLESNKGEINVENFKIKYFSTPGHTNGSLCYGVNDEFLFTGDTLFARTCGRTDLISGNEEEMTKSLHFLSEKFLGKKFYPGHGANGVVENYE